MKKLFWAVVLAAFGVMAVTAADAPKTYAAKEAAKHIGEVAVVTGHVDGVRTLDSGLTLVNLDGRYPDQELTVVVKPEHTKDVGDLSGLEGKTISVRGSITEFKGKPQIEITAKDAISEVKK